MDKRIRVVYVIASSAPYGSNRALLNLLDMVVPYGVEPLVVMSGTGGLCDMLAKRNIPYRIMKYYYSVYPRHETVRDIVRFLPILIRTLICNTMAKNRLIRLAREFSADLIHTNIGPLHIGYAASKKMKIPHVWHIREYQDLYYHYRPLFSRRGFVRKLRFRSNHPIAITQRLNDHYAMKNNATVIQDGVLKASHARFIAEKERYFLFVGRLEGEKGIQELVAAFIEFARDERDHRLLVAGDGAEPFKRILSRMVSEAGMEERIVFLGYRNDVHSLMARATALVVPSEHEGFGFTTVEAMFNGCLVIGKNSGGTGEILASGEIGLCYNSQDDLVHALKEVAVNGMKPYAPIIRNARQRAVSDYSCERNAELVWSLYQRVLRNPR